MHILTYVVTFNISMFHCIVQVGENGMAVGIDHIEELVTDSMNNIRKDPSLATLMENGRLKLVVGDGRKGHPPEGPYDAIHVGAAAPQIPQDVSTKTEPNVTLGLVDKHNPQYQQEAGQNLPLSYTLNTTNWLLRSDFNGKFYLLEKCITIYKECVFQRKERIMM